jgi:hypothetical protein
LSAIESLAHAEENDGVFEIEFVGGEGICDDFLIFA